MRDACWIWQRLAFATAVSGIVSGCSTFSEVSNIQNAFVCGDGYGVCLGDEPVRRREGDVTIQLELGSVEHSTVYGYCAFVPTVNMTLRFY